MDRKNTVIKLYREAVEANLSAKKLNKGLIIALFAGVIFTAVSNGLNKELDKKMDAFRAEIDKMRPIESEGDTACND